MRFGCFASLVLWLIVASYLSGSLVPIAIWAVLGAFRILYNGLHSEWPLY